MNRTTVIAAVPDIVERAFQETESLGKDATIHDMETAARMVTQYGALAITPKDMAVAVEAAVKRAMAQTMRLHLVVAGVSRQVSGLLGRRRQEPLGPTSVRHRVGKRDA